MNLLIREASYSDCEAVGALKRRNGLSVKWSTDRWIGLWQENPAMLQNPAMPIGWVLEQEGRVVGYLGNIPMYYQFKGRRLLAAAARGFAVDAEHRGQSLRLAAAFFSQKDVALLLNTSANVPSGSVFKLCKAEKIPYPDYDKALFWVVNARGFASSVLRMRGFGAALAAIAGAMLAPAVYIEGLWRQRGPLGHATAYEMSVLDPHSVGEEFDEFWQRTLAERSQCLLAERSAGALRWHFGHRGAATRRAKFVCAWHAGKLVGYVVLTREDSEGIGLMRSRIADLMAEKDAPDIIDALLNAAYLQACAEGSHILELVGFPERIRKHFVDGRAFERTLPSWQFWYKAVAPGLSDDLKCQDAWYGSSYDGDASL